MSLAKKRNPKLKNLFIANEKTHSLEGLNSSPAQLTGKLWGCKVV